MLVPQDNSAAEKQHLSHRRVDCAPSPRALPQPSHAGVPSLYCVCVVCCVRFASASKRVVVLQELLVPLSRSIVAVIKRGTKVRRFCFECLCFCASLICAVNFDRRTRTCQLVSSFRMRVSCSPRPLNRCTLVCLSRMLHKRCSVLFNDPCSFSNFSCR